MRRLLSLALAACLAVSALHPQVLADGTREPFRGFVALTFDDGPSGALTQRLLDELALRDVKATFFVCAYRVRQYPEVLCRAAELGHEIGLHSCCHCYMDTLSEAEIMDDLAECMQAVSECCGVRSTLFRPPGGRYSDALLRAAESEALSVILWSVDPEDWKPGQTRDIAAFVEARVQPGSVILLHDLYPQSVSAAAALVDRLHAAGYGFCTVSELAARNAQALVPGEVYRSFSPA